MNTFLQPLCTQEHSLGIFGMLLGLGIKGYLQFSTSFQGGRIFLFPQLSSLGSQESRGKADESLDTFLIPRLQTDAAGVCVLVQ